MNRLASHIYRLTCILTPLVTRSYLLPCSARLPTPVMVEACTFCSPRTGTHPVYGSAGLPGVKGYAKEDLLQGAFTSSCLSRQMVLLALGPSDNAVVGKHEPKR